MTSPPASLKRANALLHLAFAAIPAGILVAATFASNGATRIYSWPWALHVQAAYLALMIWSGWRCLTGHGGLANGWWCSLPLVGSILASVTLSAHWHDALEAALPLASSCAILPHLAEIWQGSDARRRLRIVRLLGGLFGLLALWSISRFIMQAPQEGALAWFFSQRNPHPLGHWNYTGGLALLALPWLVLLACKEHRSLRPVWAAFLMTAVIQLLSSGSRGAALGLVTATATLGSLLIGRRLASPGRILIGIGAVMALLALTIATNPRLRRGILDPASLITAGASEQQRLGFLLTGLRLGAAHPLVGIGPGTTPYHYPEYRVNIPGSLDNAFQLHCGPLQTWVDFGALGITALLLSIGVVLRTVWPHRRDLSHEAIAALTSLAAYAGVWLTDHQLDAPVFPFAITLCTAMLLGSISANRPPQYAYRPVAGMAWLATPLLCAALLVSAWRARAAFADAWFAEDRGDPAELVAGLRDAAARAPWNPIYENHLACALVRMSRPLPPEQAGALRQEARAAWMRSIGAAPAQDHPWLNLGWLALADERPDEALAHFTRAATIQPMRTGSSLGAGLALLALGRTDEAAAWLYREICVSPAFILSPAWRCPPFDSLRPDVLNQIAANRIADGPCARDHDALLQIARWWWTGQREAHDTRGIDFGESKLLQVLAGIETSDPSPGLPSAVPPPLADLIALWKNPSVPPTASIHRELASSWSFHLHTQPDRTFAEALRTFEAITFQQVQRPAEGVLFRQVDGTPLIDLTEIPASPLAAVLAPLLPARIHCPDLLSIPDKRRREQKP